MPMINQSTFNMIAHVQIEWKKCNKGNKQTRVGYVLLFIIVPVRQYIPTQKESKVMRRKPKVLSPVLGMGMTASPTLSGTCENTLHMT